MRRRSKTKFKFSLIIIVPVFLLILPFLLLKNNIFDITQVELVNNKLGCVEDKQLKEFLRIEGQNLLTLNTQDLNTNIKNKFFCVKEASFSKLIPNKIKLDLKPRQPVAILVELKVMEASTSSKIDNLATPSAKLVHEGLLVDEEGVIFGKNNSQASLPSIVVGKEQLSLGQKNEDIKKIVTILEKLRIFKIDVRSAFLFDNLFIIETTPKIIFKMDSKIDTQIGSLQLILEKAKIDSEVLEFIDLRFDKPVVRFAPKKK